METEELHIIKTKNPDNTWVALDIIDGKTIIAEGKSPAEVSKKAKKSGIEYMLMFVTNNKNSYIL